MPRLRLLAVNIAVVACLLVVIEGLAGYASFVLDLRHEPNLAERRHTRHDPLLGWSNRPWASVPDMYGPGVSLKINGQGFRSSKDFSHAVPDNRIRIICLGDSFTLGYGVADDRTWCHLLSVLEPRFETVNMGQGGYGLDQAYLWYERDGGSLEHHVQVLALISEDLERMGDSSMSGYRKPGLILEQGRLVVKGVPVPPPAAAPLRLFLEHSRQLRTIDALHRIRHWAGFDPPIDRPWHDSKYQTLEVATRVLGELKRLSAERSSRMIVVHLPVLDDFRFGAIDDGAVFLEGASQALGIPYRGLRTEFAALPPSQLAGMFLKAGDLDYPGSEGHYTVAGNEFVARAIHRAITELLPAAGAQ